MKICIPVTRNEGAASPVSPHFGSAPFFMIVDIESGDCRPVTNKNPHHDHGMCVPMASLAGERIDGMVVAGIGSGALAKLGFAGIRVFLTGHATVEATAAAFRTGTLKPLTMDMACAGPDRGRR